MIDGHGRAGLSAKSSPSAASGRSRASANTAFRKATPPPSRCSSMPPAGSRPSIRTSSARRSSTRSRWASMRRRSWCATRATMASRSAPVDVNLSDWDCTLEEAAFDPGRILPRHAEMRGVIRTRACRPARLPPGQGPVRGAHGSASSRAAATATIRCATCGCAPASMSGDDREAGRGGCLPLLGLDRREALWAVRALDRTQRRRDDCRCSTGPASACATTSRKRACRSCRSASMSSTTTARLACR